MTALLTLQFFERYGKGDDVLISPTIFALDKNGVVIAGGMPQYIGENFFGDKVQKAIGPDKELNSMYRNLFAGKSQSLLYSANFGERFSSGSPVFLQRGDK